MIKRRPSAEHADTLSLKALRGLVTGPVDRVEVLSAEVKDLREKNAVLREENEILRLENARLKVDNQMLRDEIARLKDLPPRPPFRPSGMDKATDAVSTDRPRPKKPRGLKLDVKRISREKILRINPPAGSRFKGYRSCIVRELVLMAEIVRYRRECWITPEGRRILAPLPAGVVGGYGANLRRLCMMLHAQGQVTTQRLTTLLNDIGVDVSKRQVVRLLTRGIDGLAAEDSAVLHAGLVSSDYVTVDDTGARHFHNPCYATQIGGPNFTVFRTTPSKSRLNFLSLLRGNYQDYVLNDAAFDYLDQRYGTDPAIVAGLRTRTPQHFCNEVPFLHYLANKGIDIFDTEKIRPLAEAGIWGAIRHHGLIGNAIIVSDDAGQFRVGTHALCWVHSERLLQKLMPATPGQVKQVETIRDLIWRFYKALKAYRQKPDARLAAGLEARFDRSFAIRTGYDDLDKLLLRLSRRKAELLRVLDRPEIPLNTNASENDLRSFVIKRKISGGTMSRDGRIARDTLLGLMKTCQKLGLSFWHYLGDRLAIGSPEPIPPLATLITARA
ncbi:FtsZ-binding cell division protein ZapB [Ochrobactrum sp. 19YEA23]|uniref:IS66 family transposase n=1 Tax=Ochrobactrum sp. 19YEA23 TaxID=3039854 RepID=UPI0024786353|nr:FtsZ-binding cell division protein ZapB [Ochrobactrum sp. 19YEA23]